MFTLFQHIKKRLQGKKLWELLSRIQWQGIEIADFRNYNYGDDAKTINWKLSAKFQETYVNTYLQDQDASIYIFLDNNKNFLYRTNTESYFAKANKLLEAITYSAKRLGADIHFAHNADDGTVKHHIIKRRYNYFIQLIKKTTTEKINPKMPKYSSNLKDFLQSVKKIQKKSIILIISDFLAMDEENTALIRFLNQKHELFLIKAYFHSDYWLNFNHLWLKRNESRSEYFYSLDELL